MFLSEIEKKTQHIWLDYSVWEKNLAELYQKHT